MTIALTYSGRFPSLRMEGRSAASIEGVVVALALALAAAQSACGPDGPPGPDASLDGPLDAPADAPVDATLDAPKDAGLDVSTDATVDGPMDSASEAALDGSTDGALEAGDASTDAKVDSGDAALEAGQTSCNGNGVVEPGEECDDQPSNLSNDSCSSLCEVRDTLAHRLPSDAGISARTLGLGRHPISGSPSGFAVAWIEPVGPNLGMTFYNAKGVPSGLVDRFAVQSNPLISSAPGVAALPGGKYAVAWTDLSGDGDAEGIALRLVNPSIASSGAPGHANATTAFSQYGADVLWTGTELVVAWADTSSVSSGPDLRYRTFDANLNPTSAEQTLAASLAIEDNVALAPFAAGWAAAWREASGGFETVRIKAGNVAFSVGPFVPGPYNAPPAIAEIDGTHLLVVFIEHKKLRGAVLDVSQPGTTTAFDIAALAQGLNPPAAVWPNAMRVGSRMLVAWSSEAVIADPRAEETWLKEVSWNGSSLDLTRAEIPLPRWDNHRLGDQRFPALAAVGNDLAGAWLDLGSTFPNSGNGDVAVELIPQPTLRRVNADGGGL